MSELSMSIEETEDFTLVRLDGSLALDTIKSVKDTLLEDSFREKNIKVSMKDLDYFDSSGVGLLISLSKLQEENGKMLILINDMKPELKSILQTLSFDKYFNLEDPK